MREWDTITSIGVCAAVSCRFETTKNVAYMVLIHNTADMYLVRRVLFLKMWEKVSVSGLHWTEGASVGFLKSL